MIEIWKDIEGYEGRYQISTHGRVKSLVNNRGTRRDFILRTYDCKGYRNAILLKKNLRVHRLVSNAFIANPNNKPDVNHKNGIRDDNMVDNLEWVTKSENALHAHRVLKCNTKRTDECTIQTCIQFLLGGISIVDTAKMVGISIATLRMILKREGLDFNIKKRIPEIIKPLIIRDFKRGESQYSIAKKYNIIDPTLRSFIKRISK